MNRPSDTNIPVRMFEEITVTGPQIKTKKRQRTLIFFSPRAILVHAPDFKQSKLPSLHVRHKLMACQLFVIDYMASCSLHSV